LQEAEARRAAEAALEKERQEERKALREVVLALVEKRFPMLRLTRQITKGIEHTSTFQTLLLQISTASTPEEVHQYLLAIGEEEDEE
jgi:hypothetical protein